MENRRTWRLKINFWFAILNKNFGVFDAFLNHVLDAYTQKIRQLCFAKMDIGGNSSYAIPTFHYIFVKAITFLMTVIILLKTLKVEHFDKSVEGKCLETTLPTT